MDFDKELARVDSFVDAFLDGSLDPSKTICIDVCGDKARVRATHNGYEWQFAGECDVECGRVLFTPEVRAKIEEIRATPHRPPRPVE